MLIAEFSLGPTAMPDADMLARVRAQPTATPTLIEAYQSSGGVISCDDLTLLVGK